MPTPNATVKRTRLLAVLRALRLVRPATEDDVRAGAMFSQGSPTPQAFDPQRAMSALAAFPWVVACVDAISTDLSGLPWLVEDRKGKRLDNHPLMALLENPSTRMGGVLFHRQVITDFELNGNAYALSVGAGPRRIPSSLMRLHPSHIEIRPDASGGVKVYDYDLQDAVMHYPPEVITHIRGPSWEDDPRGLYGTGKIQVLNRDLVADLSAVKRQAATASSGRPSAIVSPSSTDMPVLSEHQMREIRAKLDQLQAERDGGIAILGAGLTLDPLSWSSQDMGLDSIRDRARTNTIAVFGVPPVRLGLETANYATAQQQTTVYWTTLVGKAALMDAAWTRLAQLAGEDVTVRRDFSGVDALQDARSDNLQRVATHIQNGVDAADAYEEEGFHDIAEKLRRPVAQVEPLQPEADAGDAELAEDLRAELEAALSLLVNGDDDDKEDAIGSIREAIRLMGDEAAA